jgi:integrating conjugative element protein (TIGR03749 family)
VKRLAFLILACLCRVTLCPAIEVLPWEHLPLAVHLVVGHERVLFVPRKVRIGVPPSVTDRLRAQTADNAVYLRASAPLPPTRIQLQDVESGALILLDVSAEPATPNQTVLEPIRIVNTSASTHDGPASYGQSEPADTTPQETPVPVLMTRYAAQSLYAPLRTVEPLPGIVLIPVRGDLSLDTLLPTQPIRVSPLAAWRLNDEWVTALKLTNLGGQLVELDPRTLQGNFIAATFQHHTLGPVGDATDTTVLYLVTHGHGLADSLLPAVSSFDASLNLPSQERRALSSPREEKGRAQ